MRLVLTTVMGFAAVAALAGVFVGLPAVARVFQDHGSGWGAATLAAIFLACAGVAGGAYRPLDRLSAHLGPLRRAAAPDGLHCQRCSAPARLQDQFCHQCDGTDLGLDRPAAAFPARSPGWPVAGHRPA